MSKKKIITFMVGIILVMVLLITLPYKVRVGSVKLSKIDYYFSEVGYTYKIDLPQLKGDAASVSLFNAGIYEVYNDFISFSSTYELKENAINDLFTVDIIEEPNILFLIIKMNNNENKLLKVLYFDKLNNLEITSERYVEELLVDEKNQELVNRMRNNKDGDPSNINNVYFFKDKDEKYKKAITYTENNNMNYIIKEIE